MNVIIRWKIAVILLAMCCIALAYRIFDLGISRTYLNASMEASTKQVNLIAGLVSYEWRGMQEEQVMRRLKAYVSSMPSDSVVLKQDSASSAIFLEGIKFEFHEGKLVKIEAI